MVLPSSHSPSGNQSAAGNEGGSVRPTVGVKLPWRQFAADRLVDSMRYLTHLHFVGIEPALLALDNIEMLLSYQARCRAVYGNRALFLYPADLKYSLVSGCYIGGKPLPKSR